MKTMTQFEAVFGVDNLKACFAEAVKIDGMVLRKEPAFRTPEVCMDAVKQNGLAIAFVPQELLTKEIVSAAAAQNPGALHIVHRGLNHPELIPTHGIPYRGELPKDGEWRVLYFGAKDGGPFSFELHLVRLGSDAGPDDFCGNTVVKEAWAFKGGRPVRVANPELY